MNYYIYILYSSNFAKYYVGFSADPWSRVEQHNSNSLEKFTGKTHDWQLRAVFFVSDQISEAMKIEKFIKKQKSRKLIERLIDSNYLLEGLLAQLVRVPHVRD